MENKTKSELRTDDPEVLQNQMQTSLGMIKSMISNYIKSSEEGKRFTDTTETSSYSTPRPERLGVGAKFLSHNAALKSERALSKGDLSLKAKMFKGKGSKAETSYVYNAHTLKRSNDTKYDESDEEESKFSKKPLPAKAATSKSASKKGAKPKNAKDMMELYLSAPSNHSGEAPKSKKKKKNSQS
ncbi:hypothetical protein DSO57_1030970 [Entomophthora muscae]|uniref:Uncharacterized protein n=1 Tax=Entomophthora muscae TaxID=34485 RepID=A0ACC2S2V4_9FUNG|nr:hypothetical protein DSO57_1030970 [Entomophthora muscae]